ncbi:MAG TPA: SDR family oxidoreductase [Phaeodactylibacter sp.]|nr:SDR family oxidoreductase [Phaeodactylibacter sp.]
MSDNSTEPTKEQNTKILLTGGAGFIGSNLVEAMLQDERIGLVRVIDNLATGHRSNIEPFMNHPKFEFVWGDIREYATCLDVSKGMDKICHLAALGSVPRSIQHPVTTNNVNITGTLNIFTAARELGIKRVVYAASSSTYGDSKELPKREDRIGSPISPYAVTKLVNELYAKVYGELYGMEFIGLRYFNIFGPKQDPNGAYAAVIPLFVKALLYDKAPRINGDGEQSRDFTYVDNAVQANIKALFTQNPKAVNQVYNIACGDRITINELYNYLRDLAHSELQAEYGPERAGDVKHSLADISKAQKLLGYVPEVSVREGLRKVYGWYAEGFFHGGGEG